MCMTHSIKRFCPAFICRPFAEAEDAIDGLTKAKFESVVVFLSTTEDKESQKVMAYLPKEFYDTTNVMSMTANQGKLLAEAFVASQDHIFFVALHEAHWETLATSPSKTAASKWPVVEVDEEISFCFYIQTKILSLVAQFESDEQLATRLMEEEATHLSSQDEQMEIDKKLAAHLMDEEVVKFSLQAEQMEIDENLAAHLKDEEAAKFSQENEQIELDGLIAACMAH